MPEAIEKLSAAVATQIRRRTILRDAMNTISAYVFRQALGPLLAILGALAAIAILTQGLNQLNIIVTNRRAGFAFAWVTLLALPQLISLILPMAVFIAVVYALNRMHSESEIAVQCMARAFRVSA